MSTDVQDSTRQSVEIDHSPTVASSYAAVAAAVIAGLTSAPFAFAAIPLGIGGIGMVAGGLLLRDGSRLLVTLGSASLLLSVLVSGGFGTPVELLLLSTSATVLAWDIGQNAISLGEQMGRHSQTQRNEVIHASTSTIVALIAGGIGYGVYLTAGGGRPVSALVLVFLGVVLLMWAIRT